MKRVKYILLLIVILSLLKDRQCVAQNYADKEYYLVDSLDLDALIETDRQLIDSCLRVYYKSKDDTSRINALNGICENMMHEDWSKYQFFQYDLIKKALTQKLTIKEKKSLKISLAACLNNIGFVYKYLGDISKALEYYHKSHKVKEEIGDKVGIAEILNNIGTVYNHQGDIVKSLEYYHQSLKIYEEIGDKEGICASLNNIGVVYYNQDDLPKALEYYHQSLKIRKEMGVKYVIATSLNNIGIVYGKQGDMPKALEYYHKSLKIREEIGYKQGIAYTLHNIGFVYDNQGDIHKALEYYYKSLKLREEIGDKKGITYSLHNIGKIKMKQREVTTARTYAKKALQLAQEIGFPELVSYNSKLLSKIAQQQGNYSEALKMYKLHITMRDSINNEETQKAAIHQQTKYEYEKQKVIDDAEHEKQLAIEQEAKAKQQILTVATSAGLGLVGIFLFFVFNRLKVTRKQKGVIEKAHIVLEEKNAEILDSINYAKRIQSAILPPVKLVKEYLQESFILYKPKDIVAGDFYWLETISDENSTLNTQYPITILFAAADCTGHGVPGAMVSVVCNNGLNRAVREHGLTDPGKILDKTREIVVAEFEKSEEEVKDGMDIALCSLSVNSNQSTVLKYAGAHNPLWIIRKGSTEIEEIKANKQPIGQTDNPQPYTNHKVELNQGDAIYIFSDGYADQFGGEKGKKMKTANFKKLLLNIKDENMQKQKELIDEAFESWKGDLEQLDDVCVIGVRV